MAGKGDTPRPMGIDPFTWADRYAKTFGTRHDTKRVVCDRCQGTGFLWDHISTEVQTSRVCPSCLGAEVRENVSEIR